MEFLRFLEGLRFPLMDTLMQGITEFGSETIFLVAALVLYWCVDKRKGYYLMAVGFLGTIFNQFLKISCRILRPWDRWDISYVESAKAGATGYSFPSGHSQTAVGTFGVIAMETKRTWLRAVSIALMILVPFSRMYLGVHTPADVLVGSLSALALVLLLRPVVFGEKKWVFPSVLGVMIACGIAFLLYMELTTFPVDVLRENLDHAHKNAYTLLGAMLGFLVGYIADVKKIHFSEKAVWWAQLLKAALGLGIAVALRAALKAPLTALFGGHNLAHGVRYFLVVLYAAAVWPMTFRWFEKLGGKTE